VAQLISFEPATPPVILSNDQGFGLKTNYFTFRFQGVPGQACVIERSDFMRFWAPVATNILRSFDPVSFADPVAPVSQRYYRVRLNR
jgi:hypothetical protein